MPWPEGKPFRILSIDGGGIRGILPAALLSELEARYTNGQSVGEYFDLIAGTSTGGIIALGLSVGLNASAILDLYQKHGHEVFPSLSWDIFSIRAQLRKLHRLQQHAYDPTPLRVQLEKVFSQRIIGDARKRLCIPSFDGNTETYIFKTPHHENYKSDWRESMITAAMATAAAPTFFPIYKDGERYFGDGGVWANNPIMVGLVDALVCYRIDRRQVHILSLGTGDSEIRISHAQAMLGGRWDWMGIIESAMHLQSQNVDGQAGLLVGRDHLMRLNAPPMPEDPIMLDDYARASNELPPIATRLVDEHGATIKKRFLYEPAEDYAAFYGPRASDQHDATAL